MLEGRFFTDNENRNGAPSVAVITQTMAKAYWPAERAVGRCFYMSGADKACTEVIGVVADARLFPSIRPTTQWASAYYVPIERISVASSRALLVRTAVDPSSPIPTLRRQDEGAGSDLPYVDVHPFDDVFAALLRPWRLGSTVFVVFGVIGMIVAGVGQAGRRL